MTFPSLRRKTTDTTPSVHDDKKPASASFRARSATLPALSPRKSLSALLDNARGGRPASPSRNNPRPDASEENNHLEHESSNTEPDLQRRRTSSPDKPKRFRRSPSPHPLKGSVSSRLSKINGTGLNRRRSESSMKGEAPSKTFLETLANVIRSPASLFYKEHKQTLRADDTDLLTGKKASASEESNPSTDKTASASEASNPSTDKSAPDDDTSPKKSVRFRPGNAIIEPEAKSSPINIPKPTPPLPQVEPATTPPLQCLKKLEDPVPTGRPPQTHIMRSSEDFRKALADTKQSDILDNMKEPLNGTRPSKLPAPPHEANIPIEDPFDDAAQEADSESSCTMLKKYDDRFQSRKSQKALSSTDAVIDSNLVYNDGAAQESGSSGPPESVDLYQKQLKAVMLKGRRHRVSAPVCADLRCQIDAEDGCEIEQTSPVTPNTVIDRAASDPEPRNANMPIPSLTAYGQLLENRRSFLSRGRRSYHSADSDISSLDVDNCSNASLYPTETVKSFGPYGETLGSGKPPMHRAAVEYMQVSGKTSKYVASEGSPQDSQLEISITPAEPTFGDGLPQGRENEESHAGKFDVQGIESLAGPGPAVLASPLEKGAQPRSVSLGLPTTPAYRVLSYPYKDQYGWTPFDDYQFVYAARVALAKWENDFRAILTTKGGFRCFWDTCDLPKWSAPSEDTNALTLWEVDDLLNSIYEHPLLPEPVPTLIYGDFKARILRTSLERAGVKELSLHPLDEMTEISDDSLSDEEGSSFLSTGNFRDVLEDDADGVSKYTVLRPANTGSVPVLTEKERMVKVARVLQNFRPRKEKILHHDDTKIIEKAVEGMSLTPERPWSAFEVDDPKRMLFSVANGELKRVSGPAQDGSIRAFTSSWCRHCGRSYELMRSGKLTGPKKRNGDGSDGLDENVVSECCGISSEGSDEDEKYCQGIV
ncbi:hypothetical protein EDD37DRAFT_683296 [Exophiala viscosa]|uniref:uncharacterized protein n=1 Tax=Exophiala viscosa TaxID=2486360 RepID=UPI002192F54E|nr:hypothetical protein EDD37DRAFT_683296 [Exophiala viscosa]